MGRVYRKKDNTADVARFRQYLKTVLIGFSVLSVTDNRNYAFYCKPHPSGATSSSKRTAQVFRGCVKSIKLKAEVNNMSIDEPAASALCNVLITAVLPAASGKCCI